MIERCMVCGGALGDCCVCGTCWCRHARQSDGNLVVVALSKAARKAVCENIKGPFIIEKTMRAKPGTDDADNVEYVADTRRMSKDPVDAMKFMSIQAARDFIQSTSLDMYGARVVRRFDNDKEPEQ